MTSFSTEVPVIHPQLNLKDSLEPHNDAQEEVRILPSTGNTESSHSNAENKCYVEMKACEAEQREKKAEMLLLTESMNNLDEIAEDRCVLVTTVDRKVDGFTSVDKNIGELCSIEDTESCNELTEKQWDIEMEEVDNGNQEDSIEPEPMETRIEAGPENLEDITEQNEHSASFQYNWTTTPKLLAEATEEYQPVPSCENFTKGCQWSPDGTCLLVPSEDFRIRVYELPREVYSGRVDSELVLPPLKPALVVKEGGLVYDSCWYPLMNSWDPSTCCFASTSRESPVHLWDAFTGELRATYRAYNQVDEVAAAISVQFIHSGREVWCGFKGAIRTFDTSRPGRQTTTITLKKDIPNVTGIVSCIRENPAMPGLVAFGTYSKAIGLYKDGPLCALNTASGVTQIEFSPCGTRLYSAVRRNNEMLCWDLRNPGTVLYSMQGRQSDTNQRIQFSISPTGADIASGGTDGVMSIWQPSENIAYEDDLEARHKIKFSHDCVNGVSLHRSLPIVASSSGQRICDSDEKIRDNSVRLWWCAAVQ